MTPPALRPFDRPREELAPEANRQLAGQFYIEVDGRFLMDDVPSRERMELRRVLRRYRAQQTSER